MEVRHEDNLHDIGYSPQQIARYYRRTVGIITVADMVLATAVALVLRGLYVGKLSAVFTIEGSVWPIVIAAAVLTAALIVIYNYIILKTIRTTVEP